MLRRGLLAAVLSTLTACDTGDSGQVPSTMNSGGSPTANGGNGGSSGNGGSGGIDLGIAGIGGLGSGALGGESSDGGVASLGGANGSNPNSGGAGNTNLPRFYHYIRGSQYSKLVLEIDSVAGQEPRAAMATRIPERFAELLDKPAGISFVLDDTLPARGDDFVWTADDLDQLTRDSFDGDPDPNTIAIHISYVDGHSDSDGDSGVILGVAWGWLQVVMFKQTLDSSCGGSGLIGGLSQRACEEAEFAILSHEIGHILGLVDNGLPMVDDHRDPEAEHGAHDFDQNCVMYWAYEGQGLFDQIGARLLAGNDESLPFCQHCLDDLNAAK